MNSPFREQAAVLLTFVCAHCPLAQGQHATYRPLFGFDGTAPSNSSSRPFLLSHGRLVAFNSACDNLVPGDANNRTDCFVLDQATHRIELMSIAWDGRQANDHCLDVRISEDGRYAAFYSWARNLVPADTNGWPDIFVRDLRTFEITRVSVSSDGEQGNDAAGSFDITPDARFVSFASHASNMVNDDTNGRIDVFLRDRMTAVTERVSVSSAGEQAQGQSSENAISADGRFVAFRSTAPNLVSNDTNGWGDIFVRDRWLGTTEVVSVSSSGELANGGSGYNGVEITPDGRYVAFGSDATNLVEGDTNNEHDVFVHDRWTGVTERASLRTGGVQASGDMPAISDEGRYVAFFTTDSLVPEDTNGVIGDIYVHDRLTRNTRLISRATEGWVGNNVSAWPVISGDGRFVAFESDATNLVPNDNNSKRDVFVHVWRPGLGSGR